MSVSFISTSCFPWVGTPNKIESEVCWDLPCAHWVTTGKSFPLSGPQFPSCSRPRLDCAVSGIPSYFDILDQLCLVGVKNVHVEGYPALTPASNSPIMEMGFLAKRSLPQIPTYLLRHPADHRRTTYSVPKNTTSTISCKKERGNARIAQLHL